MARVFLRNTRPVSNVRTATGGCSVLSDWLLATVFYWLFAAEFGAEPAKAVARICRAVNKFRNYIVRAVFVSLFPLFNYYLIFNFSGAVDGVRLLWLFFLLFVRDFGF